jgi:WD40 repeat protein
VSDLSTGKEVLMLTGHSQGIIALTVTPDGKKVISSSGDHSLKVWDLKSGKEIFTNNYDDWVHYDLAITPDGEQLISALYQIIAVDNLSNSDESFVIDAHTTYINAIALTPDGMQLISASSDKTIKVWNIKTRKEIFTLIGHTDDVKDVAVTAHSKQLISVSSDNTLKVWNLATAENIATFTSDSPMNSCAVAEDGVTIVAGDSSGRVHFLRLENVE